MKKLLPRIFIFLILLNGSFVFSKDVTKPEIVVHSRKWTWKARLEYINEHMRCLFRDEKISPFLSRVFLKDKEDVCLIENCGPSIAKFEKTSIEYKDKSFTIYCENPVPEITTVYYCKTKGTILFPDNKSEFSIYEQIKILKKGNIAFSSFSFDFHAASPLEIYIKSNDKIEKIELKEIKDYRFEINSDFFLILTKKGIICVRVEPPVKKDSSIPVLLKGDLFIQNKEKTTTGYVSYRANEVDEGTEIVVGINFYLLPASENIDDVIKKIEEKE
ncbi:MAG: hypothetical protein NC907_01870 [Candidatus Omnitrophica bacterium]|nr:hypothetical protein [Candidatus Omnitrophota bacterium]